MTPRERRRFQAIAATFLVNGGMYASLLPRFPQIKATLDLSDAAFGYALVGMGFGGLLGSMMAAAVITRLGNVRTTVTVGFSFTVAGLLPALAPSGPALFGALTALGILDALHDTAMNDVALAQQRRRKRSLLSRLHALWSGGGLVGASAGAAAAAAGVPVPAQMAVVSLALGTLQLRAGRVLAGDSRPGSGSVVASAEGAAAPGLTAPAAVTEPAPRRGVDGVWLGRGWLPLGIAVIAVAFMEGPPHDWSAVYLRQDLGAGPGLAGLGPVVFAGSMLLSRLAGDRLIDRYGGPRVAAVGAWGGGAGVAVGLALAAAIQHPLPALFGFAAAGAGVAPVFPLLFAAAGRLPGSQGAGPSLVSGMSRLGFLTAPVAVGTLAERASLGWGLALIIVAAGVIGVVLPRFLRSPAGEQSPSPPSAAGRPNGGV